MKCKCIEFSNEQITGALNNLHHGSIVIFARKVTLLFKDIVFGNNGISYKG